jgi:hypothetical protein
MLMTLRHTYLIVLGLFSFFLVLPFLIHYLQGMAGSGAHGP